MKKSTYLIALAFGVSTTTFAQNVGINTDGNDPDANTLLHLNNDAASSLDSALLRIENEKATTGTGVQIENQGTASSKWDIIVPGSSTDLRIKGNGSDHVTIQNDGDVGIGTSDPTVPLHVKGGGTSAGDYQFFIENESYNKGIQFQYKSASGSTYDFPQAKIWTSGVSYDTKLNFSTANGTTNGDTELYTALTIDDSQNVGIGT